MLIRSTKHTRSYSHDEYVFGIVAPADEYHRVCRGSKPRESRKSWCVRPLSSSLKWLETLLDLVHGFLPLPRSLCLLLVALQMTWAGTIRFARSSEAVPPGYQYYSSFCASLLRVRVVYAMNLRCFESRRLALAIRTTAISYE